MAMATAFPRWLERSSGENLICEDLEPVVTDCTFPLRELSSIWSGESRHLPLQPSRDEPQPSRARPITSADCGTGGYTYEEVHTGQGTLGNHRATPGSIGGGASSPASSQDDGDDDAEECTADAITLEDGILCLHGLECETLEAGKLCFKMG